MEGVAGLKKECSMMEVEEEEEEIDTGIPRYETIKILFDPISIAQYKKQSDRLVTLEELYPPRKTTIL